MEIKMSAFPGNKPGIAGKIQVAVGDKVQKNAMLVQVETGKGNQPVKSAVEGIILQVLFEEGDEIKPNQVLFEIEECTVNYEENIGECIDNVHEGLLASKESIDNTEERINTDLLVIGGGPGGYVAAIYAAKRGLRVTLVEKEELGGTCLNVGCIPTKALVKSAEIFHDIKRSEQFGVLVNGEPQVDMKKVIARKNEVRDKLVDGISYLLELNQIRVIKGTASFLSENCVVVRGNNIYEIMAKNIIVATGSVPSCVSISGIEFPFVLNSTQALSMEKLPKSITIIGGGIIGMEFAFIYRYLGVKVHVVEFMDRLLTMIDDEACELIKKEAEEAGICIHTSSKVKEIKKTEDGEAVVIYENDTGEGLLVSENVLVAIGREANIKDLEYEKAGLVLNKNGRGIAADTHMRTNKPHIYAIGDVTNIMQLAHVASHQGMVAVKNIMGENVEMDYAAVPNVVFTSPEIASVGFTEDMCKKQGVGYKVSKFDYSANGKALTLGEARGFIKLISEKDSGKLIGATIIGADASTLIATVTLTIQNGITAEGITETIFAHPTTSEIIHEAAMGLGIGALHI